MKTVVQNARSDTMKVKNSRKLCSFNFSRKEDLRSYLNYNKKRVLYINMFFKGINSKPKQAFGVFIKNSSKVQEEVLNEVWKATFFPPKESRKKKKCHLLKFNEGLYF